MNQFETYYNSFFIEVFPMEKVILKYLREKEVKKLSFCIKNSFSPGGSHHHFFSNGQ
jgi:hypothetical protein